MIYANKEGKVIIETDIDVNELGEDRKLILDFLCLASEGLQGEAKRLGMASILNLLSNMEAPSHGVETVEIQSLEKAMTA